MRTFQLGRRATTPPDEDETADAVESPETDIRDDGPETERAADAGPASASEEPQVPAASPVRTGAEPAGQADADADADADAGPAAPSPVVRRAVLAAFVLMLVAAVVTGLLWNVGRAAEADRQAALEAAQEAAVGLTSINFETAEQDVRRVVEESTGDFGGLFKENLDSYIGLVKESKIATQGEVTGAGVDSIDGGTARVVLAVKANVSNQSVPDGEARFYRMVTELEKKDGEWLVSRVEFVP